MERPQTMSEVLNAADRIQFVLLNYSKNEKFRNQAIELLNQVVLAASWAMVFDEDIEE